jgi:hypothetical protein
MNQRRERTSCRNPSLKLVTKAKGCEGADQVWSSQVTFHASGVQESMREWTLTLLGELPLWELESQ